MAADNASTKAVPLSRRFSADISVLSPTRSAGNLIASPGAESASKARQLRHASTFNLRYIDPDMSDSSLGNLLRRHLLTQANGASDSQLMADAKSNKHTPSPPKKLSAKVERALQLRDQCERDLKKFCETKRSTPHSLSPASSPCRAELLDKSYWFNPEHVHDNHGRDKSAFDRLMRKLSPAMKNAATTHVDLVHMLQACGECALRATFCPRCAKRASEFFENYTIPELQALYCRELPPPDAKALDKFAEAMAEREYRAIH